jgi:hypothetical protein
VGSSVDADGGVKPRAETRLGGASVTLVLPAVD